MAILRNTTIEIRLSEWMKNKVKEKAEKSDYNMSEYVRRLIYKDISGRRYNKDEESIEQWKTKRNEETGEGS